MYFSIIKTQVHLSLSTQLDVQLVSRFESNQKPFIVPRYATYTNADVRGDPFLLSHLALRHSADKRIRLQTSAEVSRRIDG